MRKWHKTKTHAADRSFSAYIRLRDTDENGNGKCVTCQQWTTWDKLDCGHYQTRNKMSTRFDERNAHAQCQTCNRWNGGEKLMHGERIIQMYGQSVKDEIDWKSNSTMRMSKEDFKEVSKTFRAKARVELAKKSDYFKTMHKPI